MVYLNLFVSFLKIGLFTIGNGHAMLAVIEREILKYNWMTKEEFYDLIILTQSIPGPFSVNIASFVGYRVRRKKGALLCAFATVFPSLLIIMVVAFFFTHLYSNEWVEKVFKGIRPVVAALIAVPCITMMTSMKFTYKMMALSLGAAVAIAWLHFSPFLILLLGIGLGIVYRIK